MIPRGLVNQAPVYATYTGLANGSMANTDTAFFIADRAYEVVEVSEVHTVAGTDAGSVTGDVKINTGTQAPDSAGTSVLASTFNLKSTINTVVAKNASNGGLVTSRATRTMARGDRLVLDLDGTLTALVGLSVTVVLLPIGNKKQYY